MISFIMMAYNVEKYIADAIVELQKENEVKWELIIVDDFSTDSTFEVAKRFADGDERIKLVKNTSKGKVTGTNYGYSLTSGDIIKCIDSDDVLLQDFFREYENMKKYDAHCHSAFIADHKLNTRAIYNINPLLISKGFEFVLSNLVSFPKWSWSFSRKIAEKIFPMPETLPFEDVWIALTVKKYSKNVYVIDKPIYLYRQHDNQTFGGIINYSKEKVIFRAKRLLALMDVLENEPRVFKGFEKNIFDSARVYNRLMSKERLSVWDVLISELRAMAKFKIILIKKFPMLAKYATILKWKLDALLSKN
ncbi:glycosyltransferase family 2 protein [Sulfurospirillum tamanense]|nr:glycosyltransferase [Sulfurospirillum tamanensis]